MERSFKTAAEILAKKRKNERERPVMCNFFLPSHSQSGEKREGETEEGEYDRLTDWNRPTDILERKEREGI